MRKLSTGPSRIVVVLGLATLASFLVFGLALGESFQARTEVPAAPGSTFEVSQYVTCGSLLSPSHAQPEQGWHWAGATCGHGRTLRATVSAAAGICTCLLLAASLWIGRRPRRGHDEAETLTSP